MPVYEIEAPDGRVFEVEGDREPTQAELAELVAGFDRPAAPAAGTSGAPLTGLGMGELASRVGSALMGVWDDATKLGEAATFQAEAAKSEAATLAGPVRGALQGTGSAIKALGIASDYLAPDPQTGLIGAGPNGDPREGLLYRAGQAVQDVAAKMPQPAERSFLDDVLEGVGQVVPGAAAAVVAGPYGAFAVGGGQEFTDAYDRELERQKKAGEQADYGLAFAKATGYGLTAGAIEARFGAGRIVSRVKDALAGKLKISGTKELILGRMKDAGVGFTEEAVQRAIQDLIVDGQLDKDAILQEGGVGAVVQGILGLPGAAIAMRPAKAADPAVEAAAEAADRAGLTQVANAIRENEGLVQGEPGDAEFEALVSPPIQEPNEAETVREVAVSDQPDVGGIGNAVPPGQETATQEQPQTQEVTLEGQETQGQEELLAPAIDTVPGEAITTEDPGTAVPTYEPEALATEVGAFLQTEGLPDGITIVQEPDSPWAAKIDNGKIVLNASQIKAGSNVGNVLLEEGLHGIWDSPELSEAWRSWKRAATKQDVATERAAREGQQLPDDVLQEEAVIQRLLANRPEDQGVIRKIYEAIRKALLRLFGVSVPNTEQGRKALLDAARGYLTRRQEYNRIRYAAPQVKPSKGYFKGEYVTRPDAQTEQEASAFLGQFATEGDALTALENPTTPLRGDVLAQSIGILGDRILSRMYQTEDPAEQHALRNAAVRLAKLGQVSGTVEAQDFRARQRMKDKLTPHSALLTLLNLINEQQRKVVDEVVDVPAVTEGVKQGMEQAGDQAVETVKKAVRGARAKKDGKSAVPKPEKSANRIVSEFATSQSDTLSWSEQTTDAVRVAVREQLKLKLSASDFSATLQQLGVSQETANVLADIVAREIEIRDRIAKVREQAKAEKEGKKAKPDLNETSQSAQSIIGQFAKTQSDTPSWPKQSDTRVRDAVNRQLEQRAPKEAFIAVLVSLGVKPEIASKLADVVERESAIREQVFRATSGNVAESDEDVGKTTDRIISRLATSQSDTPSWSKASKSKIEEAVRDQIKNNASEASFIETLVKLGVERQKAETLAKIVTREIEIRKAIKQAEAEGRLSPPSKTASAIVSRLAKSQSDTPSWPAGASNEVEAAVRAQLEQKAPREAFASVLVELGVQIDIATQLAGLVEREIEVRRRIEEAKADQKAAEEIGDAAKIAGLLDKAGVQEDVDWSELFKSSQASQKARQKEFFDRIQADPRFARLNKSQRAELANTLFRAWELQRIRIFRREFDRLIPGDPKTPQQRVVKKALPKLIEYVNLGMLDADATRDAIAGVFGMETMDGALVKRIQDLSEQAQKLPLDSIQQNQALNRIHRELVANAKIPMDKLMSDFWYSNVLGRTSTFLNVLMGSFFTGLWAQTLLTEKVLLADRAPGDVLRMWRGFFRGLGDSILAGSYITATGDRSVLPGYRKEVDAALSMKNPEKGIDTFEALVDRYTREGKKFRATWAKGQALTKRIMTALDYIGSQGVREAALFSAAHSQGDEAALEKLRARFNRDATKQADQQARAELGDDAPLPVLRARRREILEQGINQDVLDAADNVRRRVAANAEPHGLVGMLYRAAKPLPFLAKSALGLQFMRAAANMINWTSDAIPGVGLAKYAQSKLPKGNSLYVPLSAEDRALALGAQATGLALIAGLAAMFLNDDDDGWDITAGWAGLTPSQKKLLRDKGESTYSITTPYGKFSYKQISGLNAALAFVGTLRDQQRFNKEQWNEKSALAKLFHAYLFGSVGVIKDLNTITSITDVLGQTAGGSDEAYEARLVNFLTRFGSGFVPFRGALSEFDAYTDRKKYIPDKEDVTGALLRNLPFARRAIGEGPDLNLFGEPIKTPPNLLKNWVDISEAPPEWKTLARMAEKGYWLSEPELGGKDFVDPITGEKREMTLHEKRAYAQARGAVIREAIIANAREYEAMNAEELADAWKKPLERARRAGKWAANEAALEPKKK